MPMSPPPSFPDLMRRVRAGDDAAAAELVRAYEPAIRRVIRFRLNPRLRRLCDSLDICQAVLGKFFVHAALGQFDLNSPDDLIKLLSTMARNEVLKEQRRQQAARRDLRRDAAGMAAEETARAPGVTPSQEVAAAELFQEVQRRLTAEERQLAEWRQQGRGWDAIAAEAGGQPDALRKKLARALERVMQELGLGEDSEE
jgi:RNA polymerase sigma factor (sigma-70 family)